MSSNLKRPSDRTRPGGELESELGDRLRAQAPDEYIKRREFLQRAAITAGLGLAASVTTPYTTLVAEAARQQRRSKLPAPRDIPIDTIVVLMMENRSFDHYLGWLPNADGRQAGLHFTDRSGNTLATRPMAPDTQGCGHPDPDHSWKGGRTQMNGGAMDGFLRSGGNDIFSISYYRDGELGFIQDAAKQFQVFDHFHCSLMASTLPNREYMHAADSYGLVDNDLPPQTSDNTLGFPFETTIWHALQQASVSCRYFGVDIPVSALWGAGGLTVTGVVEEYYARCATGTLPRVSFVDPFFAGSAGEGPGLSGDEHPHGDVRTGQAYMADVVHALLESPQWKSSALFIVYDEWGGFFDHVVPPRVPDKRNDPDVNKDYGQMGMRIPALCISPYALRGGVSHSTYGFESILKFISYRFGLKPLNKRVAYASNIGRSLDYGADPLREIPDLPRPEHVVSQACPGSANGPAQRAKEHDLVTLASSGYLDRLGYEFREARPEDAFREPSKVMSALR